MYDYNILICHMYNIKKYYQLAQEAAVYPTTPSALCKKRLNHLDSLYSLFISDI